MRGPFYLITKSGFPCQTSPCTFKIDEEWEDIVLRVDLIIRASSEDSNGGSAASPAIKQRSRITNTNAFNVYTIS